MNYRIMWGRHSEEGYRMMRVGTVSRVVGYSEESSSIMRGGDYSEKDSRY